MRNSILLLPVLFLLVGCGGTDANPPEVVSTEEVLPTSTPETMTDDKAIADIQKVYAKTTADIAAGTLKKDSIDYNCEDAMRTGIIHTYSDAGGIVMVANEFGLGDHAGMTERYYFKDGNLAFIFVQFGSWSFGGPMTEDEAGNEVPGTEDTITEDRYYFNDGALVKHLNKSYKIKSWEEEVDPATIPNETMPHNGETPGSYNFIAAFMATRTVDCKLVE